MGAPTSAPTMAPTSSASGATAVLVAAPPGKSQDEIEEELTAQVVATLGLGRRRARQLRRIRRYVVDATTTTIDTVSTVIDCQEIFMPPAQQPPNVDVCYRVTITITIQSSTESSSDSQEMVDNYIEGIFISVRKGVFTDELQYIVVEEGSTDITGVPTISPTSTPTIAPVVPTTPVPTKPPTKAPINSPTTPTVIRWTSYTDLTGRQLGGAMALYYTKMTWNTLGTNSIEESAWYYLTPQEQAASEQVGIGEEDWDCYQNHYGDYSWSEL